MKGDSYYSSDRVAYLERKAGKDTRSKAWHEGYKAGYDSEQHMLGREAGERAARKDVAADAAYERKSFHNLGG